MRNYAYHLVNILENRQKMLEVRLEIGMNDLAGRLNEMPWCLFSLCMVKDTASILYSQLTYTG